LFYALFEMLSGMFVRTAYLSPTIWIASLLSRNQPAVYKPLNPKRIAWAIGITMISICLTFFNPVPVAHFLNDALGTNLSTEENFLPLWLPLVMVWLCIGLMWAEVTLGFCVGCKLHALLVKIGVFKEACEACNNIDWDAIARRAAERKQSEQSSNQA
jgi:hypothetical protein